MRSSTAAVTSRSSPRPALLRRLSARSSRPVWREFVSHTAASALTGAASPKITVVQSTAKHLLRSAPKREEATPDGTGGGVQPPGSPEAPERYPSPRSRSPGFADLGGQKSVGRGMVRGLRDAASGHQGPTRRPAPAGAEVSPSPSAASPSREARRCAAGAVLMTGRAHVSRVLAGERTAVAVEANPRAISQMPKVTSNNPPGVAPTSPAPATPNSSSSVPPAKHA